MSTKLESANLDFDYLSQLYKTAPEKFEEIRAQEINDFIQSSPKERQKRLRGLQFQIDSIREINKNTPMKACVQISQMMHNSFDDMRHLLNQFAGNTDYFGYKNIADAEPHKNQEGEKKVLKFRR